MEIKSCVQSHKAPPQRLRLMSYLEHTANRYARGGALYMIIKVAKLNDDRD